MSSDEGMTGVEEVGSRPKRICTNEHSSHLMKQVLESNSNSSSGTSISLSSLKQHLHTP
jgi:hypothetical protein